MLGLCCCKGFSLVAASGGYSPGGGAWDSHCCGFFCCGAQALGRLAFGSCGTWDLPGPGIEPVSPELTGGFFTAEPPGEALQYFQK